MGILARYSAGAFAIVERDARTFLSYRSRIFTQVLGLIFSMATFYYVSKFVRVGSLGSSSDYFAYVTVGLVILLVLQSSMAITTLYQQELVAGTFERLMSSPTGPIVAALAMTVFPIAVACVVATLGVVVGASIFGLDLEWATAWLAIPVGVLGACAFATIGVLFLSGVVVFKTHAGVTWVVALLGLTGGVYFPVALLPGWLAWIAEVQPFVPAVDLMRHLLLGVESADPPLVDLAKLAGWTAVMLPLVCWVLGRAIRISRRRGTILEY